MFYSHKELNSIKDIVTSHQVLASKLCAYANQCQDAEISEMFKKAATDAERSAQNLIQIL